MATSPSGVLNIDEFGANADWPKVTPDTLDALLGKKPVTIQEQVARKLVSALLSEHLAGAHDQSDHGNRDDATDTADTAPVDDGTRVSDPRQMYFADMLGVPEKQLRLASEARLAIRDCDNILDDREGEEIESGKTYEDLDDEEKLSVKDSWITDHEDEFTEEPMREWEEYETQNAESELLDGEFPREFIAEKLKEAGLDPEMVKDTLLVNANGTSLSVSWNDYDDEKVRWENPEEHAGESALEALEEFAREDFDDEFMNIVHERASERAQEVMQDSDMPDGMREAIYDATSEAFENLSEDEKTKVAYEGGDLEKTYKVSRPEKFEPFNDDAGKNYTQTQACARVLQRELTRKELAKHGFDVSDDDAINELARKLWSQWKHSSTSNDGLLLQYAMSRVVRGDRQDWGAEKMNKIEDAAWLMHGTYLGDRGNASVEGGMKLAEASVRATWAASQYILREAGVKDVNVFRAVMMPGEAVKNEPVESYDSPLQLGGQTVDRHFERFTNLTLKKNGAASTTVKADVANNWGGAGSLPPDPVRVVLKISAPAEAVLSLPCFGQNITHEQEVVLAGTHWNSVEAWKKMAPPEWDATQKVGA